jgi:hypothetical protein
MKIIEGQVKIPPGTVISTEMRNIILWLLQKDPNARPSIKHILNEVTITDLRYQFGATIIYDITTYFSRRFY